METILITGTTRGIGLELTKQLLDNHKVIATYRNQPSEALKAIEHENLTLHALDVTDTQSINQLAESLSDQSIDILINNAGIVGPEAQDIEAMDVSGWLDTFSVNTIAPFQVSKALLPSLKQASQPRIFTISSQMASLADDGTNMMAYRTSKTAVNKVMQMLSVALKEAGIGVFLLHPGWVRTDMGGPDAPLTAADSATGLVKMITTLTIKDTGKFFTWAGDVHPW